MLNQLFVFVKHIGSAYLIMVCLASATNAQDSLKGKWLSYSLTYKGKEISLKKKKEKTLLVFETDKKYIKYFYSYNRDSTRQTMSYNLMTREVKDDDGKILKKSKSKENGSYHVQGRKIIFLTNLETYSAQYKIEGDFLFLTQLVVDSLNSTTFIIKFKRLR